MDPSPLDIATLLSLLAGTLAFGYWGGQMKRAVSELVDARMDHEERIRKLEGIDASRVLDGVES